MSKTPAELATRTEASEASGSSSAHQASTPTPSNERLHSLDAVRAIALLLGVVLHTTLSFLPGPQVWVIVDTDRSTTMAMMFYVIHMFRMVLFFLIAGFFARLSFHRIGETAFIKDRIKRIAVPLFVGWPIIFPMIVAVFVWSAYIAGGGTLPKQSPPGPTFMPNDFPLAHLWFLWILLLLYTITIVLRRVINFIDKKGHLQTFANRATAFLVHMVSPVLLALPLAVALASQAKWYMWFGVPTPDQTLYANLPSWVAFGSAFSLGWLVQRQPQLLQVWQRRWHWNTILAMTMTVISLALLSLTPASKPAAANGITLVYAMCYSIGIWAWTFAIIGFCLRFMAGFNAYRRYLADASYWVYLIHLPIVMALQVWMAKWSISWAIKFPAILIIAMTTMLLSYQLFVRRTAIGVMLNGKRMQRIKAKS